MLFAATRSTCAYLWLFAAVLSLGRAEEVPDNSETTDDIRFRRMSPSIGSTSCLVPPQPKNGRWKLNRLFCDADLDCDVPQGILVQGGSKLVYSCDSGYRVEGNPEVYCQAGTWSTIPNCIQIKCSDLNSASRKMTCLGSSGYDNCDTALPETLASVSCRPRYQKNTIAFPHSQGERLTCTAEGRWSAEPMECIPVCGVPKVSSNLFPWHASLYLANGTRKNYICGATIILEHVLLTSARCVYDEETGVAIDPGKLFVMTGNTVIDYDSPSHDPEIVKKASVEGVYTLTCTFPNSESNFPYDLALIGLQEPFVLSDTLMPACFDLTENAFVVEIPQPGDHVGLVGVERRTLRNLTVPYSSFRQSDKISADEFVNEGSGVCGSGLVLQRGDNKRFIMGVLNTGLNVFGKGGQKLCNMFSYSHYIRTSAFATELVEMVRLVKQHSYPDCRTPFGSKPPDTTTTTTTTTTTPSPWPTLTRIENFTVAEDSFCLVPPQPKNGEWRFHGYLCENNTDCEIPQGTKLRPGSRLVYRCSPEFRASENTDVYCGDNANWSPIPECIEVRCDALNSASSVASCSLFGKRVSCDYPVPSETRAEISCRKGYKKDTLFVVSQRETLSCNKNGKWKPDPIRCIPICGVPIVRSTPLAIGGTPAEISDFPWHATLYRQKNWSNSSVKEFKCGATIIHTKFLLTAAHCIYEENSRTTVDPADLFVMTGNIFRDYDSPAHDPQLVRKGEVKNVYKHFNYYGLRGNYASDIALLELQQPFEISDILLPACLNVDANSERILEHGAYGRVAGFGRTATGESSGILQTITLPYVSYKECTNSSNAEENEHLISDDKFCAGYTNGSAVCEGDSGGGLVFQKNELWYVMGIVSVGFGVDFNDGQRTCDKYSYTLYTKVSSHMNWIQDIILNSDH